MGRVLKLVYREGLCRVSFSQIGNEAMSELVLRLSWHQRSHGGFGCLSPVSTGGIELFPTLLVCPPTLQWLLMACSRSWELNTLLGLCHGKQSLLPVPLFVLGSALGATITHFITEKAVSLFHTVK